MRELRTTSCASAKTSRDRRASTCRSPALATKTEARRALLHAAAARLRGGLLEPRGLRPSAPRARHERGCRSRATVVRSRTRVQRGACPAHAADDGTSRRPRGARSHPRVERRGGSYEVVAGITPRRFWRRTSSNAGRRPDRLGRPTPRLARRPHPGAVAPPTVYERAMRRLARPPLQKLREDAARETDLSAAARESVRVRCRRAATRHARAEAAPATVSARATTRGSSRTRAATSPASDDAISLPPDRRARLAVGRRGRTIANAPACRKASTHARATRRPPVRARSKTLTEGERSGWRPDRETWIENSPSVVQDHLSLSLSLSLATSLSLSLSLSLSRGVSSESKTSRSESMCAGC